MLDNRETGAAVYATTSSQRGAFAAAGVGRRWVYMLSSNDELLRLELPCDPSAPAAARSAVRELTASGAVPEDAVLLVSELVSSEVLERGPTDRETIELVASNVPDGVRIAVESPAHGRLPSPKPMVVRVLRGLARRWGIAQLDGRPELWAELAY